MQTTALTATGTIREQNQDFIIINDDLRMALIVDGTGPSGATSSKLMAEVIVSAIKEFRHVYSAEEAPERLINAVTNAQRSIVETSPNSIAGFSALWIHRGIVRFSWSGKCKIASNGKISAKESRQNRGVFFDFVPVSLNQRFFISSEGLEFIFSDNFLNSLLKEILANNSSETLQMFWGEAGNVYDGDDRSMILVCIDNSDSTAGNPKEIELFTEIDRQVSIPLWLPASAAGAMGVFFLFIARKIYLLVQRFRQS